MFTGMTLYFMPHSSSMMEIFLPLPVGQKYRSIIEHLASVRGVGATLQTAGGAVKKAVRAMDRILEPEIMNDSDADAAYARADFSDSNQAFADRLAALLDH